MHARAISTWGHFKQRTKITFASLVVRNYRLYFIGQGISICGTWMQTVAQGWLVLQITGSGTQVGLVVAVQFLPLLFITPVGGMVADAFNKRRTLFITQGLFMVLQFTLAGIVIAGVAQLWMIYVLALLYGLVNSIDNPTRQAFASELVEGEYVRNAVTLNATVNNLARAVGPSIGAVLIATVGIGFCFLANGFSTFAILVALIMMRPKELHLHRSVSRMHPLKQLSEGLRYVRRSAVMRDILIMAVVIGTFSYEFQTSLPILAKFAYGTNAGSYAQLWVALGVGSVVGGLVAAGRKRVALSYLLRTAILFGISMLVLSAMPTLGLAVVAMLFVGYFSINFTSLANTTLQLEASPEMRGRVMSLWTMAMLGSTPIGGPIVGYIADRYGARYGLVLGGAAAFLAGIYAIIRKLRNEKPASITAALRASIFQADLSEEPKFR